MKRLDNLLSLVAHRLSGHPAEVRLRKPIFSGYAGFCYRSLAGKTVIDVNPDLTESQLLTVLLHEIAHAKLHSPEKFIPTNTELAPGSLEFPAWLQSASVAGGREGEAEAQASEWLSFAKRNSLYHAGESELEKRLRALYCGIDFAGTIERQTQKAVKSVIARYQRG